MKQLIIILMALLGLSLNILAQSQTGDSKKVCFENKLGKFCIDPNKRDPAIEKSVEKAVNDALAKNKQEKEKEKVEKKTPKSEEKKGAEKKPEKGDNSQKCDRECKEKAAKLKEKWQESNK